MAVVPGMVPHSLVLYLPAIQDHQQYAPCNSLKYLPCIYSSHWEDQAASDPTPPHWCLPGQYSRQPAWITLTPSQSVTQHLPSYVRAGTYSTLLSCSSIVIISNFSSQIILLYCLWLLYWSGNDTITSFFSTLPHLLLAVFPSPFSSWGFLVCFVFPASIHAKFLSFTTEWSILSLFFC